LIVTGTMGAGKTAVLTEASDILSRRGIVHAAIDLDALGVAHLSGTAPSDTVMYENLRSIGRNYAALGVQRFIVARAIEGGAQLKLLRDMIPTVRTTVCRLTASLEMMERRVEMRELGISQRELVARVAKLHEILDRARLEDFTVANENRALTEVALEMLVRAGWIEGPTF
jgi:phosphosulfolactate synthase (CoM biosynthesis protein A)